MPTFYPYQGPDIGKTVLYLGAQLFPCPIQCHLVRFWASLPRLKGFVQKQCIGWSHGIGASCVGGVWLPDASGAV